MVEITLKNNLQGDTFSTRTEELLLLIESIARDHRNFVRGIGHTTTEINHLLRAMQLIRQTVSAMELFINDMTGIKAKVKYE